MPDTLTHPPFGSADLTNCERELIHLAGSIQPHGALVVLREPDLSIIQASENTGDILGVEHAALLSSRLQVFGEELAEWVSSRAKAGLLRLPEPHRCSIVVRGEMQEFEVSMHRQPKNGIVLEMQPIPAASDGDERSLAQELLGAVGHITAASTKQQLADAVVTHVRDLTGYDRVMVYQFDEDGHGEIIAEARDERFEPFLGQRYPASDIPQRARELYLRNRVRVLVDVGYLPVAIVPRHTPGTGEELDMSLCGLRSMSPLHLQYLQNMGVTATLVASLVREGKLWGLIACHHYSAKSVRGETRSACELLSEVTSTRISALENRSQVEAELFVRGLEHSLVLTAQETGDWRDVFFENPREQLLAPLMADGAALFYEGEVQTAGDTPSRRELRALVAWLQEEMREPLLHTSSLLRLNPEFEPLSRTATGVLAIELSKRDGEYLVWFRKEQIHTVTWAGNPRKPVVVGNDPRDLSPRRSFAAWSELVRNTAKLWSVGEVATASAIRLSLVDMILQMRALRALIAERHATTSIGVIESADQPMILASGRGDVLVVNDAFHRLVERPLAHVRQLDDLTMLATEPVRIREMLSRLNAACQSWRGELRLVHRMHGEVPVAVRADPVPGLNGDVLGYILIFTDLRLQHEAHAVRRRLERTIAESHVEAPLGGVAAMLTQDFDKLLSAVLANASAAIMQITDASAESSTGELLRELEETTRRAADLTTQILSTVSQNRRLS